MRKTPGERTRVFDAKRRSSLASVTDRGQGQDRPAPRAAFTWMRGIVGSESHLRPANEPRTRIAVLLLAGGSSASVSVENDPIRHAEGSWKREAAIRTAVRMDNAARVVLIWIACIALGLHARQRRSAGARCGQRSSRARHCRRARCVDESRGDDHSWRAPRPSGARSGVLRAPWISRGVEQSRQCRAAAQGARRQLRRRSRSRGLSPAAARRVVRANHSIDGNGCSARPIRRVADRSAAAACLSPVVRQGRSARPSMHNGTTGERWRARTSRRKSNRRSRPQTSINASRL